MARDQPGTSTEMQHCYVIVNNIGRDMHSKDLRSFFSDFVETEKFDCFHFRHRPEKKKAMQLSREEKAKLTKTRCCVARLTTPDFRDLFIEKYHGTRWVYSSGHESNLRCCVMPVKEPCPDDSRTSLWQLELQPPSQLPWGNVGTPTKYLMNKISLCKLPAKLIGQLGLRASFRTRRRKYGSVPMEYGSWTRPQFSQSNPGQPEVCSGQNPPKCPESSQSADECDSDLEEWERHDAMVHDVDKSQYSKQVDKLYEEEMEITWEKGGPGLVFYTDSFFWDQQKGTDCDERWHDLWDVDTSVYYGGGGDKDSNDIVDIRKSVLGVKDVMTSMGWQPGTGLGPAHKNVGKIEPAAIFVQEVNQQRANIQKEAWRLCEEEIRPGFGYSGPKLQRFTKAKKRPKHIISTVYDNPAETDPPIDWMRTDEGFSLKYRDKKNDVHAVKK